MMNPNGMDMLDALWANHATQVTAILLIAFVAAKLVDWITRKLLLRWARKTRWTLDEQLIELLCGPLVLTALFVGAIVAVDRLDVPQTPTLRRLLQTSILLLWTFSGLRVGRLLVYSASRRKDKFKVLEGRTLPLFDNITKIGILLLAIYVGITIWQVDPKGWIASAGIVGIAVGFAAKDTLSNLFAGVFIIADAPYQVGDFILLESGERGQVAHIGLRSTRLVTRDDIEITIPNAVIGNARITNESAGPSPKHRIRVKVGVAYGSDIDQVRAVLMAIAAASEHICETPAARVRFRRFGESSLDFELLVWIPEPIMRGQVLDELNTAVYKSFAGEGISIPFPQRDLYVKELPRTQS